MDEWDEGQKTDPDQFAEPAPTPTPAPTSADTTKRRCAGCALELPPCDCSREARAVGVHVLETLHAVLVAEGLDPGRAARFVQKVAREAGVTLL